VRARWRSLVSLIAGAAIALMALAGAFARATGPDWFGLLLYLLAVAVAVVQWDGLFGAGAGHGRRPGSDARPGRSGPGLNALCMAA